MKFADESDERAHGIPVKKLGPQPITRASNVFDVPFLNMQMSLLA
jgi:hypothetical protein